MRDIKPDLVRHPGFGLESTGPPKAGADEEEVETAGGESGQGDGSVG